MSVHRVAIVKGVLHLENLPYPDGTIEVRLEEPRPAEQIPEWLDRITLAEDDPSFVAPDRAEEDLRTVDLNGK